MAAREHFGTAKVTRDPLIAATVQRIENARAQKKIPHSQLCRAAGVKPITWSRARRGTQDPQRETLQALERACATVIPRSPAPERVLAGLFHAAFRLIALEQGISRELMEAVDLTVQRPADADWLAVSRARSMAIYIVAVEHEVPHSLLAGIAGISKQKIGKALERVENWRDDAAIDAMLERVRAIVAPELRA